MLKLYKRTDEKTFFWEAWPDGEAVVVHEGTIGETGHTRRVCLGPGERADREIEMESFGPRNAGYSEIELERLTEVVVQYELGEWELEEALDKGHYVEDLLNGCLGWTGNGHCDSGDIGCETINAHCYVVDPGLAAITIVETLSSQSLLDGAVIAAYTEKGYQVLYPADYPKEFFL